MGFSESQILTRFNFKNLDLKIDDSTGTIYSQVYQRDNKIRWDLNKKMNNFYWNRRERNYKPVIGPIEIKFHFGFELLWKVLIFRPCFSTYICNLTVTKSELHESRPNCSVDRSTLQDRWERYEEEIILYPPTSARINELRTFSARGTTAPIFQTATCLCTFGYEIESRRPAPAFSRFLLVRSLLFISQFLVVSP